MSDWHSVETPNAPEGLADLADDSTPTRVDEETGDTPASQPAQNYQEGENVAGLGTPDDPIAVVVVGSEVASEKKPTRLATGFFRLNENSIAQVVGRSLARRSVNIKVRCEATDGSDYVLLAPDRENVDVGYRLDHGEKEEFAVVDDIYVKAVGGNSDVFWYAEEID